MNLAKIREIGKEMNRQSNRHTQAPLFVVQVDVKRYVSPDEDADGFERKEDYTFGLCDECEKREERGDGPLDECDHCTDDCFLRFKIEKDFDLRPGVFFTAAACDAHIKANPHHYTNARSYAISAWCNEEMLDVMRFLSAEGDPDGKPKNFYV